MSAFFSIGHNSHYHAEFPWAGRMLTPRANTYPPCPACGLAPASTFSRDLEVRIDRGKGSVWPDALGSASLLFIVSTRVLEAWNSEDIGDFPIGGRIKVVSPLPARLTDLAPPEYVWLDGSKMVGAKLDKEASGTIGFPPCPACGLRQLYVEATYQQSFAKKAPYVFVEGSWNGANLFKAGRDQGGTFFCTEKVLACAKKYQHTNFRFLPIEEGHNAGSRGVEYL